MDKKFDFSDKELKIIDNYIKENEIELLVTMPKGTIVPEVKDNTGLGAVMQLYILMAAIEPTLTRMWNMKRKDGKRVFNAGDKGRLVDSVLQLVREDIMKGEE